ncbi:TlpA family protein disulfide reductase [Nocardioides sp. GXQ0305]|uniref:TlpA family protein disulfide reductase n=1 Tax=Nocardioides sp. GXQ0305 TaxID=3423912 RepID=UPI003D7E29CA
MSRVLGLLAAAVLVLSGCSAAPYVPPGEARIDVDTPQLRRAKDAAGVDDCPTGGDRAVNTALPPIVLPCLGGGPDVPLAYLRGPMVVSFWASWCQPCRQEMPVFQKFHERYGDRVSVLGIDYQDAQPAAALELVAETGATYPQLADPGGDLNGEAPLPRLRGMPFLVLIGSDGRIAHLRFGELEDLPQLTALVEEHLEVSL